MCESDECRNVPRCLSATWLHPLGPRCAIDVGLRKGDGAYLTIGLKDPHSAFDTRPIEQRRVVVEKQHRRCARRLHQRISSYDISRTSIIANDSNPRL
jgi:hypothetical protein